MDAKTYMKESKIKGEELKTLLSATKNGDIEAKNKIIEDNLWIAAHINQKYGNTEDGFQEGIFGLEDAIKRYDVNKKVKFQTYAFYFVRMRIARFRDIDVYKTKYHLIDKLRKMKKFSGTEKEFAKINNMRDSTFQAVLSLSSSQAEYTEAGYSDRNIQDNSTTDEIESFILKDYVNDILKRYCSYDEEKFIRDIFFNGKSEVQVAKEMGVCKQAINNKKLRILSKLRGVL